MSVVHYATATIDLAACGRTTLYATNKREAVTCKGCLRSCGGHREPTGPPAWKFLVELISTAEVGATIWLKYTPVTNRPDEFKIIEPLGQPFLFGSKGQWHISGETKKGEYLSHIPLKKCLLFSAQH